MSRSQTFGLFDDDQPEQRDGAEWVLEELCMHSAVRPAAAIKQKIWARLGFEADELQLGQLPQTNKYSNYLSWLKVVEPLLPTEPVESIFMQEIRRDERFVQTLVVTRVNVPEETHEEYAESFFILEGRCACTINGKVIELSAGDYLDIPLHVPHDVKLITTEVKAILQYQLS